MECTSRTSRLSSCLLLVGVLLLSYSLGSAAASRRLLQSCSAQEYTVPQAHFRALHFLRPLKWSDALADRAAQWAEQYKGDCAAASPAAGVNVFRGYAGGSWQPSDAVAAWAEEKDNYDYGSDSCVVGKECGHYRQLVWRDSTQLGCASVDCASGETLMTCHYEPQGNLMGQKPF
ncbi:pathogenesis-related protein PRB1-3-like [Phragmites australis]|uniref:pathogenesis-related protein PRB1-3-like n=1 Tax=Phragmites australis TaxID=29695 RepID=UPI002D76FBB4|nr:pathogenesis-related protein PRB1-3-like [Phragmites australis]